MINNYTTPLYNDPKAFMASYLYWKKDKTKTSYLELYCPKMPFKGNVNTKFKLVRFSCRTGRINYLP
jgi:hypothetical protein